MLARKSLLILLTNLVGALGGIAALWAIGRYMGPAAFGMFAFTLGTVKLLAFIARLGLEPAHKKRVSEGSDLATCIGTYATIKLVLLLLFAAVAVAAAAVWDATFGLFSTSLPVIVVVTAYVLVKELGHVAAATFDGLRRTAATQAMDLTEHMVRTPLVVTGAIVFGAAAGSWVPLPSISRTVAGWLTTKAVTVETGAILLAFAYLAGSAASAINGFVTLRRSRYPVGGFDPAMARRYAQFALPLAFLTGITLLSHELDRFMIGYFWAPTEVGYYFSAQRIVSIAMVLPTAVATLFFPLISELASRDQHEAVRMVSRSAQRYLGLVMVLMGACFIVFAEEGVRILQGNAFLPAAPILALLALNALVATFTVIPKSTVKGYDRPRTLARIGLVIVVCNVVLNLVFIPSSILGAPLLGMRAVGAAWATLISQGVGLMLLGVTAYRLSGGTQFSISTAKQLMAGLITAAALLWLKGLPLFGGVSRFHHLAMLGIVAAAIYGAILLVVRELQKRDWLLVRDVLNPGKMVRSIREDFDRWEE